MAENENAGLARSNVDNSVEGLLRRLGFPECEWWLTGENNFRYSVYPEYKANRLKTPRPRFLKEARQHLIDVYGAKVSDGCEADDMLGVGQCMAEDETIISSPDKDLLMIPGWHHIPELKRLGKLLREDTRKLVSPNEGLLFFYTQLLIGDPTDNIKGVRGMGAKGAGRLLGDCTNELDYFTRVREAYGNDVEMEMNARVLWLWRKHDDNIVERWKEMFGYEANQNP